MIYNSLHRYFKQNFSDPIIKISIDAGFSCPNRDGSLHKAGCFFCNPTSFLPPTANRIYSIEEQIRRAKKFTSWGDPKYRFWYYYQAYSSSHAPRDVLWNVYQYALEDETCVGLTVGTRSDCITPDFLDLVQTIRQKKHIWIEIGVQSKHEQTLKRVNRQHTAKDTENAVHAIQQLKDVPWIAHLMHGLPGETPEMMVETAQWVDQLGVHGIKFHQLLIMKDTVFHNWYREGRIQLLSKQENFEILARCLAAIRPNIIIHRLFSQAQKGFVIAPEIVDKDRWVDEFRAYLNAKGIFQGKDYIA